MVFKDDCVEICAFCKYSRQGEMGEEQKYMYMYIIVTLNYQGIYIEFNTSLLKLPVCLK